MKVTTVPEAVVTVQMPFRILKRGGRKEIVLPVGVTPQKARPDSRLVKALARAFRRKRMLESGEFATNGDPAAHEKIAPSYTTRVMSMTLLSPEIVEGTVEGRIAPKLAVLFESFPVEWGKQKVDFR